MKTKKRLSVLLAVAMVVTMLFGIAAPAAAAAAATAPYNVFSSAFTYVSTGNNRAGGNVGVYERQSNSWKGDVYVTVTLPEGVNFNATPTQGDLDSGKYVTGSVQMVLEDASKNSLRVKMSSFNNEDIDSVTFKFNENNYSALDIESSVSGDIRVTVEVMQVNDGAIDWIESDTRTIARVTSKSINVTAATPTIVQMGSNKPAAKITLQESAAGAFSEDDIIEVQILSSGVKFSTRPNVTGSGVKVNDPEFHGAGYKVVRFKVTDASSIFPGKIEIKSFLDIDPTASGDIQVRVRNVSDQSSQVPTTTLTVATLGTATVEITNVQYNTGTIYAGHQPKVIGTSASNTARFVIKATAGSKLPDNRMVVLELSGGVKFADDFADDFVVQTKTSNGDLRTQSVTINFYSNHTKAWFETGSWDAVEMCLSGFKLVASGDAAEGDISVAVSGSLGASGTVTLGKVAKPFTVTAEKAKLNYPGLNQAAADIVIKETARGSILVGELYFELPTGVSFAGKPTVKVTEGDLAIGTIELREGVLVVPVTRASTEPSTITISKIAYDVARAAMEDDVEVSITGEVDDDDHWYDDEVLATVVNATVGTPVEAPPVSVFTIGSMTYYVDGKAVVMDVAPIIVNDRTLLPLRYVAMACGLSEDEILWDPVRRTVTLIRGDRVVQVTIGSTTMLINGAVVTMDVEPQIIDGRTMLPIRWVALALRAEVVWDATNRTVTVKPL